MYSPVEALIVRATNERVCLVPSPGQLSTTLGSEHTLEIDVGGISVEKRHTYEPRGGERR